MGLRTFLGLKQKAKKPTVTRQAPQRQIPLKVALPAAPLAAEIRPKMQKWYAGKELTSDWLTSRIDPWFSSLAELRDRPVDVLEVGSYEGRSAIAFLSYLPLCQLTCVDTFPFSDDVEGRFDRNLAEFGGRVSKIKDTAANALDGMRRKGAKFDVIYLDAGKERDWNFVLCALAWPLLRPNGIMMWDDLKWQQQKPSSDRPGDAIRLFKDTFADCLSVIHDGEQLIAVKTKDWPAAHTTGAVASS